MAATYTPIATTTLGSAQSSVTFNSFSGYTDLVIVSNAQAASGTPDLLLYFNGDSNTANYSWTRLSGNGTAASSNRGSGYNIDGFGYPPTSGSFALNISNVMNYSNTTTYKTAISRANSAPTGTDGMVLLWRNTAAITSLTLALTGGINFNTGCSFTLYGITAA